MPARKGAIAALLVFIGLTGYAGKLLVDAGVFRAIHPHFPGLCKSLAPITGAEDIEPGSKAGEILISADFRPEREGEKTVSGAIWRMDLNQRNFPAQQLTSNLPFEFHPHGISVWHKSNGLRLFVINHRSDRSTVEVFDEEPGGARSLVHVSTIESPMLITPNDLAAASENSFFISNDHGSVSPVEQAIESYTRQGRGDLLFYDGEKFRVVDSHLNFANGVWLSPDQNNLVLAEMLGRRLRVYKRRSPGQYSFEKNIDLETAPDNVTMDEGGDLWIGAHPQLLKLKAISKDHRRLAPAQVLRVKNPFSGNPEVEEVLLDDGNRASAVSVALHIGSSLVLGTIYGSEVLICSVGEIK